VEHISPVQARFYQAERRAWDSNLRGRVNALMVFKSVRNSPPGTAATCAYSVLHAALSKIIPRISRVPLLAARAKLTVSLQLKLGMGLAGRR